MHPLPSICDINLLYGRFSFSFQFLPFLNLKTAPDSFSLRKTSLHPTSSPGSNSSLLSSLSNFFFHALMLCPPVSRFNIVFTVNSSGTARSKTNDDSGAQVPQLALVLVQRNLPTLGSSGPPDALPYLSCLWLKCCICLLLSVPRSLTPLLNLISNVPSSIKLSCHRILIS